MNKFKGLLICTDLDGTLLKDDKSISRENLDAIEYFKSEGGYFTFITGRMPYFMESICSKIHPNAPFGCINGGGLYDYNKKEYVSAKTLDKTVTELIEYADKNIASIGIQVYTFERIYFSRENEAMKNFRKATGIPNITADYKDISEPFAKIVFGDESEEKILALQELLLSHPRSREFDFIRSERTLYEILPKGANKGSVLPKLCDHLGIDQSKTIAVGDYNNDIAMIKSAGIGFAVANASPEAKAAADHITVSNEEHAIAKIIADIENGKLRI